MNLPKWIPILGTRFRVEKAPGMENLGETLGPDLLIRINPNANDTAEKVKNTLLHEVAHGGLYISGLDEILAKYDDTGHLEEAVVMAITNTIAPLVSLKCLEE